jgi:hypothetical protein
MMASEIAASRGLLARARWRSEVEERGREHEHAADEDGGDAVAVVHLERGRDDRPLGDRVVGGGGDDLDDEEGDEHRGEGIEPCLPGGREPARERGEAHVVAAAERDDGAEHDEPEEEGAGELVGPDERAVERVAEDDAGEEDDDFGDDEGGGGELGDQRERLLQAGDEAGGGEG